MVKSKSLENGAIPRGTYFFFVDTVDEAGDETADDNGVSSKSCSDPSS